MFKSTVDRFRRSNTRNWMLSRLAPPQEPIVHEVALPGGYPAARVTVALSLPAADTGLEFCEHVMDEAGNATATVLASTFHGIALSHDLGASWKAASIRGFERHRVLHAKWLGEGEILVQAVRSREDAAREGSVHLLVVGEDGAVLASHEVEGSPWHSCRAVDMANGTLMYAEYPYEDESAAEGERLRSRVFRSRDRGRSWEVVQTARHVRHYHFLQARPGVRGEWWLTSGDRPEESNIWVTSDDGDSWRNITRSFNRLIRFEGGKIPRSLFRLTDLAWDGDAVVWGTDDDLRSARHLEPGARVFRAACADPFQPVMVGRIGLPVRSMIDLGAFYLFVTQSGGAKRSASAEGARNPGVYLMPKAATAAAPPLVHLFDVETRTESRSGFTYSRASRAARNGTFFTFRSSADAFAFGPKLLRWDVSFG